MSIGKLIRSRREEMNLTQDELSSRVGISKPYLSNIETGRTKNPPTDGILSNIEKALGFDGDSLLRIAHLARAPSDVRQEHELLDAEVKRLRQIVKKLTSGKDADAAGDSGGDSDVPNNIEMLSVGSVVPIINRVTAGYPADFTDLDYPPSVADDYIRCPDIHDPQAFGAYIVGDSMEPNYREGDIVIFSPNAQPKNGDDCFVRFDEHSSWSTTFKRYYQDNEATVRLQPLNNTYPAETHPTEKITGLWPAVFKIQKLNGKI